LEGSVKARLIASIVVAGAVALGMSGCNLIAPQATLKQYDASDGVGVTVGSVAVRNAIVVSDDGETGNLVFSVANRDDRAHTVLIEVEGIDEQFQVLAEPGLTSFDGSGANDPLRIESLGVQPGGIIDVFFQYRRAARVLDACPHAPADGGTDGGADRDPDAARHAHDGADRVVEHRSQTHERTPRSS
jgi:hypothetical protein